MNGPDLLRVEDLKVEFRTHGGRVQAVRGVSFDVRRGEVLAIVGESGCGKSVTCQSLLGLIPCPPGLIKSGRALMTLDEGEQDLLRLDRRGLESVRGRLISMIFQDPLTCLNPTMNIGDQIAEVLTKHRGLSGKSCREEVVSLLRRVQIPEPESRLRQFPHEFSGGMRQRIMIAIALACRPKLLIADEPTTALDVTIQGQILNLLRELQRELDMAIILITHDLGVVASLADRIAVMYAGEIVEQGMVDEIFAAPQHPYTLGLQKAIPNPLDVGDGFLKAIEGSPPDLFKPPSGCSFMKRCPVKMEVCRQHRPDLVRVGNQGQRSRCHLHNPLAPPSLLAEVGIAKL